MSVRGTVSIILHHTGRRSQGGWHDADVSLLWKRLEATTEGRLDTQIQNSGSHHVAVREASYVLVRIVIPAKMIPAKSMSTQNRFRKFKYHGIQRSSNSVPVSGVKRTIPLPRFSIQSYYLLFTTHQRAFGDRGE